MPTPSITPATNACTGTIEAITLGADSADKVLLAKQGGRKTHGDGQGTGKMRILASLWK